MHSSTSTALMRAASPSLLPADEKPAPTGSKSASGHAPATTSSEGRGALAVRAAAPTAVKETSVNAAEISHRPAATLLSRAWGAILDTDGDPFISLKPFGPYSTPPLASGE